MTDNDAPWWHETGADSSRPEISPVGTAAQEAIKLAAAVSEWASRTGLSDALAGIAVQTAMGVREAAAAAADVVGEGQGDAGADADAAADAGAANEDDAASKEDPEEGTEAPTAEPQAEHTITTCDYCPVCQGIKLLRTVSPDAATGVAEALSAVTDVIRAALDTLSQSPTPSTHVEHIDIE
jgi:hypothetical protein